MHRRVGLFPQKFKKFQGWSSHRFENNLYHGHHGPSSGRSSKASWSFKGSTVERVEEIEEEYHTHQVDVDELEFEAEYASGEDGEEEEDEEEEAESSEEESDEEEEGGDEDEDEDFAELTKFSRRPSRTTQADQL